MCGRFALAFTREVIDEELNGADWFDYRYPLPLPRYNIAPLQFAPFMWKEEKRIIVDAFRWGLVPRWAKDEGFASKMINARVETLHEKPAYKNLLAHHRGVVLTSGYFEWQKTSTIKQPWYITSAKGRLLPLAGLWDVWNTPENSPLFTFTIITTPASKDLSLLHNRMPACLSYDQLKLWIEGHLSPEELKNSTLPTRCYKVSTFVNNVKNDSPQCIQEI
ncbi:MAG: SOS response-associated peptidase [Candidatus Marinimicrobia bacterium]|nr:SOS response-associated peptidase [Candidatus Neomarinimicrobiota bacterium]